MALLLPLAMAAGADQLVRTLRVSVDSFAIRPLGGTTPTRVVFVGRPFTATVMLAVAALPGGAAASNGGVDLPSERWWNDVTWDCRRDGASTPVAVRPELLRQQVDSPRAGGRSSTRVHAGEHVTATFRLSDLPPAAYTIRVSLAGVRSEPYRVLISSGNENDDLRREYARYKTLNSPNTEALKKNLIELAALDPLNAGPWIRLGDLSLKTGSVEEIRGYYDRAISLLDQRRQLFAAKGDTRVVDAIDAERETVVEVRTLVPRYVANRSVLDLTVELEGGKRYVLKERVTGHVVQTIGAPAPLSEVR